MQLPVMKPPFDTQEMRSELVARLKEATGLDFGPEPKYPGIKMAVLQNPARLESLLRVMDWVIRETRAAHAETGAV